MLFAETSIKGVYIIDLVRHEDERGFFARSWCQREFEEHGLNPRLVQCNISFNSKRGTLRGMHYQATPFEEARLVRCITGAMYDVVIDLRSNSPTFKKWLAIELTANNHRALYIPEGLAHGFQTLADDTEVFYQMSEFYTPDAARGLRWDDPAFRIKWPIEALIISEKDRSYPNWNAS